MTEADKDRLRRKVNHMKYLTELVAKRQKSQQLRNFIMAQVRYGNLWDVLSTIERNLICKQ